MRKLSVDSGLTYFFLAFIAMAGLAYINFLPSVVTALAVNIGFNEVEAGQIVALNGYGGFAGCIAAIFLVRRLDWQSTLFCLLGVLTIADASTSWIESYDVMLAWRFIAGVLGGLSVGIAFAVLARLANPDRAFGILLLIQFSLGSVVIYLLPLLEQVFDSYAVFYVMAGIVFLSWLFLFALPALPLKSTQTSTSTANGVTYNAIFVLIAIILYLVAANAIWAYVGLIGLQSLLAQDSVSTYIAMTGLLGLLGALLPVISGNRFGRLYWTVTGVILSAVAAVLLAHEPLTSPYYVLAMALLFFAWPAVHSYLLAVTADLDVSGRLSSIAAVASYAGLATGPMLGASLLDDGNFSEMLWVCASLFMLSVVFLYRPLSAQEKHQTVALTSQYQS